MMAPGHGVVVLAPPDPATTTGQWPVTRAKGGFMAQAGLLDAASEVWQQQSRTVAVSAPSDLAARRWRALAGLDRVVPGGPPPEVLVVDRADRRTTGELTAVLEHARPAGTLVVLVEGGTLPARRVAISQGLQWLGDEQGRIIPSVDTGPTPGWAASPPAAGRGGLHAIEQVVSSWTRSRHDGAPTRMVALGPSECDELNRRARIVLRAVGALTGGEVLLGGRPFAVGDEVTATRRGVLPAGAIGRVRAIDTHGSMVVAWAGPPTTVDAANGRYLRHAYATTPGRLRFDDAPLVALGQPGDLGRHRRRLTAAISVGTPGPDVSQGPDLSQGPDVSQGPDLRHGPDLSPGPDLSRSPDLSPGPDVSPGPALGGRARRLSTADRDRERGRSLGR
jgi:hypothetical protein